MSCYLALQALKDRMIDGVTYRKSKMEISQVLSWLSFYCLGH